MTGCQPYQADEDILAPDELADMQAFDQAVLEEAGAPGGALNG